MAARIGGGDGSTQNKGARLNLRLRTVDHELIRRAAAQTGQTVSGFLMTSAIERAHEVLADQRGYVLDQATWEQFVGLLDQPARPAPRLVELFTRPPRISR